MSRVKLIFKKVRPGNDVKAERSEFHISLRYSHYKILITLFL